MKFGELIKGYSIDQNQYFLAGTQNSWMVCDAKRTKDSTPVSVWILKKGKNPNGRTFLDETVNFLKQEPQNLLKIRHPSFLSILEPIYEDPKQIAFITEKVDSSLFHYLKKGQNEFFEDDLDLKQNCKEILNGLLFLHESLKSAHLNISPENIMILPNGKFKLAGLAFMHMFTSESEKLNIVTIKDPLNQIYPNYSFIGSGHFKGVDFNSDMYSFILVLYSIFANKLGKPTILPENLETISEAQGFISQITGIKKKYVIEVFPIELKSIAISILQNDLPNPLSSILSSDWFDDTQTRLLNMIPNFLTKSDQEQKDFIVSISLLLPKFSKKTLLNRIIPFLKENTLNSPSSSYILSAFIFIIEKKLVDISDVRFFYKKNNLAYFFTIFSIEEYFFSNIIYFVVLH